MISQKIKCSLIKNPESAIDYVKNCADFWLRNYDESAGGFYTNVKRDGSLIDTSKSMICQSRTAFGLSKAFMLTGNLGYLTYAEKALKFMSDKARDIKNGGWITELDKNGNEIKISELNKSKWSFMQHYALLGLTAYSEVSKNQTYAKLLLNEREILDKHLWDSRSEFSGYFETADRNWKNVYGKGYKSNMDAISAHLLSCYLQTYDKKSETKLITAADNIVKYFIPAMKHFKYGFPEYYSNDWQPDLNEKIVFTGHLLSTAWLLARIYLLEPEKKYLDSAIKLIDQVIEKGFDEKNKSCYSNFNGFTGEKLNSNKEWWQLEEAFNVGTILFYITKNEKYLTFADSCLEFYRNNFIDEKFGEVYTLCSEDGNVIHDKKGFLWKSAFHSIELGFYIYCYTNLYLHKTPVTLYYNFDSENYDREIKLTPIETLDDKLIITKVIKEEAEFKNFSDENRILFLKKEMGGKFKIQFEIENRE